MTRMMFSALIVSLAIPSVLSATEFFYNCEGDSGTFETPANWTIKNVPQAELYPGEDDAICCTTGLKVVRFAEPCTTHRVARVTLDKTGYTKNQKLFMDLNGGMLDVTNGVAMKASRYEGVVCPLFEVTNGTLRTRKGVTCAGGDNNYRGIFNAFGPDTHVIIGKGNLSAAGAGSRINIGGGASVRWTETGYPLLSNGEGSTYKGNDQVKFELTGAGTSLVCTNGFRVCNNATFRVADKAVATFSGFSTLGQYGRQNRNPVGVDNGGTGGTSGAALEVDDATLTVTNGASIMVAESDRNPLTGHSLTIKNGGVFNFSGSTAMNLAFIGSTGKFAKENMIRVYSGGRLSADGNAVTTEQHDVGSINVGQAGWCVDNGIHVSNGVISVNHITLGGNASASNNWLRIEGRTGRVVLNQVYAAVGNLTTNRRNPALGVHNNARVEFAIGPDGFDNPPIEMTTNVGRIYGVQNETLGQKARIVIEDQGFARKHGGETITLIKTLNANNRAYFETLIADATITAARDDYRGTLSVSEDGKSLLYTAPPARGLMLILR